MINTTDKKKKARENACDGNQMSDLTEKDFKVAITDMFIELKKKMTKEMTMLHQIENQ